jgi:hypothetical protein
MPLVSCEFTSLFLAYAIEFSFVTSNPNSDPRFDLSDAKISPTIRVIRELVEYRALFTSCEHSWNRREAKTRR